MKNQTTTKKYQNYLTAQSFGLDAAFVANYRDPLPVIAVRDHSRDWYQPQRLTDTLKVFEYIEEHSLRIIKTELHGGSGRTGYDWDVYLGGAPS